LPKIELYTVLSQIHHFIYVDYMKSEQQGCQLFVKEITDS